jgi:hypothetical protein
MLLSRSSAYALVCVAGVFVLWRGVLPAFTQIDTDFPNYYTAGAIARSGVNTERLYDDAWFQEEIRRHGIHQLGKFSPFPPPTALLFIPFSFLSPMAALQTLSALNVLFLIAAVYLIRRLFGFSVVESLAFVLLSGWGLANCFRFGQLYIALSVSMLAAVHFIREQRNALAGMCIGALLPVKYFSSLLLVDEILKRRRHTVAACILTVALILALSVAVLGWEVHRQWLTSVLGEHLQGNLSQQNPYAFTFQSFQSLFRRLFLFDSAMNPKPLIESAAAYHLAVGASLLVVLALTVHTLVSLKGMRGMSDVSLAVLCTAGLLIAPATATYHFLLLWLPVGIVLQQFVKGNERMLALATLACYAAIGFLPYSLFGRFDGEGILTLLAYPRLFLLIALFGLSLRAARLPVPQN